MHVAAIIANVTQWIIILSIFLIKGLDLGGWVILLLFILMPVPLINFLALFFRTPIDVGPDTDRMPENGLIKRTAMRIRYPEFHSPVLDIGNTTYAVVDLSEGGVRIRASQVSPFKKKVTGRIVLLCGERIQFKARLLRRGESETVFQFFDPLGTALIRAEQKALDDAREKDEQELSPK
ncbi:MAG: hypothetical protein CSA23_03900 [Deltaproteobacteria bacterium]|nr:MAG: hypothetical protein CSA23_03900 [Deltaproteobacteria bacterium]